jgi:hypothetical protein
LSSLFVNRPSDQRVEFFVETKVDSSANVVQSSLAAGYIDFTEFDFRKLNVLEIQNVQVCGVGSGLHRAIDHSHPALRHETLGVVSNYRVLSNQDGNAPCCDATVKNRFDGDLRTNASNIAEGNSNSRFFEGHCFPQNEKRRK